MPSVDLLYRFLGVDAGAGAEFDKMSKKASAASLNWKKFGLGAGVALAGIAAGSIKAAAGYQALIRNLETGAGESQKNLKSVGSGILTMAGQVGDSADTLAKAMFTVESAGYHGAAALSVLKTAAEGAKVDNADLGTVVDALTSAMNAYHEPTANAAKVTNTLIASAAVGKMHLQDLAGALGTVLPSAAALHVPLDQVGAAMATMTAQGTDAARGATYLRFAFAALANPTSKAKGAMEAVGLTSTQVANTMTHGGLPAVFELLQDSVGRKFPAGSAKYLAALANMVGGTRGLQAVLELTGKNLGTMNGDLASIKTRVNAAGNSVSDWADVQKNFNQQWAEFGDGIQADAIRLGTLLLPAATDVLQVLVGTTHAISDVVGAMEKHKTTTLVLAGALTGALLPALVRTTTALTVTAIESFTQALGYAATAVVSFATEEDTAALSSKALVGSIGPIGVALAAAGFAWSENAKQTDKSKASVDSYVQSIKVVAGSATSIQAALTKVTAAQAAFAKANIQSMPGAQFNTRYGEYSAQIAKLKGELKGASGAATGASGPTKKLANDNADLKAKAQAAAAAINALTNRLTTLIGGPLAEHQAALTFAQDLRKLGDSAHDNSGKISDNTKAGQKNAAMLQGLAGDIQTSVTNWVKAGQSQDQIRPKLLAMEKAIEAQAGAAGISKKALDAYLGSMNLSPAQIGKLLGSINKLKGTMSSAAGVASKDGKATGANFAEGFVIGIHLHSTEAAEAAGRMTAQAVSEANRAAGNASPSKKLMQTGKWMAEGLIMGFRGEASTIKDAFSTGVQDAISAFTARLASELSKQQGLLKTAESNYKSLKQARQQAISSLAGSITSSTDISNVLGQTDANGNPVTGNIGSSLKTSVGLVRTEATDLARLRKMGLSQALLNQISAASPQDAVTLAQQILSGQAGSISSLNSSESLIQKYAKASATTVVESPKERQALAYAKQQVSFAKESVQAQRRTNLLLEHLVAHGIGANSNFTINNGHIKLDDSDGKEIIRIIRRAERKAGKKLV